jgi:hypothetical protein
MKNAADGQAGIDLAACVYARLIQTGAIEVPRPAP